MDTPATSPSSMKDVYTNSYYCRVQDEYTTYYYYAAAASTLPLQRGGVYPGTTPHGDGVCRGATPQGDGDRQGALPQHGDKDHHGAQGGGERRKEK